MKIYISGLINNIDSERKKFEAAEQYLREQRHEPISPLRLNPGSLIPLPLRLDILAGCEAIFLLSGWLYCKEAQVE